MKKLLFILSLALCFINFNSYAQFSFISHWEDDFSKNEQKHLQNWIQEVGNAVEKTLGVYPFEIQIYFHRSTSTKEPVPWAHTSRENEEAVHFYVNPDFSLEELNADWTAAHEISHLSIPFVGRDYSWFSEGFASYFQWQIMYNQGIINQEELTNKYSTRLASALPKFNSEKSFIEIVDQLKKRHDYPSYYYGGACFFIQSNQLLMIEKSIDLSKDISDFQTNGRVEINNIEDLILKFDSLSNSQLFSELFETFHTKSANQCITNTEYP